MHCSITYVYPKSQYYSESFLFNKIPEILLLDFSQEHWCISWTILSIKQALKSLIPIFVLKSWTFCILCYWGIHTIPGDSWDIKCVSCAAKGAKPALSHNK